MLLRLLPLASLIGLALPAIASADRVVTSPVTVEGLAGVEIEATQGSPTDCTRDEVSGIFHISRSPEVFVLRMVAKSSGVCAFTASANTWKLTLPEGSGSVTINGYALIGYDASCRADWTGPYECKTLRSGTVTIRSVAGGDGSPRCTIRGTDGNDDLRGTPGDDVICAGRGDDRVRGLGGDDLIFGGAGDDALGGGRGDDVLSGGAGDDNYVDDDPGRDRFVRDEDDTTTSKPPGDYRVTGNVTFEDLAGVSVTTSQGQPTNCTRDEENGTFTIGDSPQTRSFGVTIKDGGWCSVQPSHNAWNVSLPGGGGRVEVNDKGWEAPYQMRCLSGWTGPYECVETKGGGSRISVTIRPKRP